MQTTTNATPIRITSDHYQIESQAPSRHGQVYDLTFDHLLKRWICDCADTTKNHNSRCKHVCRLVAWIKEQKAARDAALQAEANAVVAQAMAYPAQELETEYREYAPARPRPQWYEDLNDRTFKLEGRMYAAEMETELVENRCSIKSEQIEQALLNAEAAIASLRAQNELMQEQLERAQQAAIVAEANHTALLHELDDLRAQVVALAQVEPVRITTERVVVDGSAKATATHAKAEVAPAAPTIEEIIKGGKLVACLVEGEKVLVVGDFSMACTCERGSKGQQCAHGQAVDAYLKTRLGGNAEAAPLNGNRGFSLMR